MVKVWVLSQTCAFNVPNVGHGIFFNVQFIIYAGGASAHLTVHSLGVKVSFLC